MRRPHKDAVCYLDYALDGKHAMSEQTQVSKWPGDFLERKPYADFLTTYLIDRVKDQDGQSTKSFTLALDAQWGQGKTFFVSKWAEDLKSNVPAFPVLAFDAWNADYASDPLVAFMAAFKDALDQAINKAGLKAALKKKATDHVAAAVNGLRRAILPAGKQLAKGLLLKTTGVATEEIYEAYKDGADVVGSTTESDVLAQGSLEAVNKSLDKFFDKLLEGQAERQKAIEEFRAAIKTSLQTLVDSGKAQLPMFVFIDELDRCRPNFAITLLEGVKHLFGVPGVCFVVSTNMLQLSEAVKAVYGQGFDGYGYLKRFFDVEYTLPSATGSKYAQLIFAEYPELAEGDIFLGLPAKGFLSEKKKAGPHDAFAWVAEVFGLDLRSQRKVLDMVAAACSGVPQGKKIYFLWFCILCAARHRFPDAFDRVASGNGVLHDFDLLWKQVDESDTGRRVAIYSATDRFRDRTVKLKEVALQYYEWSFKDLKKVHDRLSESRSHDYPGSIIHEIAVEMPGSYFENQKYLSSLATYFQLVMHAGHIVAL